MPLSAAQLGANDVGAVHGATGQRGAEVIGATDGGCLVLRAGPGSV